MTSTNNTDTVDLSDADDVTDHPTLDRSFAALAGLLAAGFSLAVSEFLAGLSTEIPSLVVAVGDSVIDSTLVPPAVRRWSIDTLGTNQKAALVLSLIHI